MCVFVCVCERERGKENVLDLTNSSVSKLRDGSSPKSGHNAGKERQLVLA